MRANNSVWLRGLLFLVLGGCLFGLAQLPRENFLPTFLLYAAASAAGVGIYFLSGEELKFKQVLVLGILLRVSQFFFAPQWSEDGVRFLWDGELLRQGQNPYLHTPSDWYAGQEEADGTFLKDWLQQLNSPTYYSVYPPLNQLVFWMAAEGAAGELQRGYLVLRLLLVGAEIGVFCLLWKLLAFFQVSRRQVVLYWFNPLVVVEITGNLHFEGLVLLLLLASAVALTNQKLTRAGFFWGLAAGLKLLPLLLAPAFLFWKGIRPSFSFWAAALLTLLLSLAPLLISDAWMNFAQSLRLYQGTFEFNASLYYLFRALGYWWEGYNTIGILTPIGMGICLFGGLYLSWRQRKSSLLRLLGVFVQLYLLYLLLQPVVHPWYLLPGLGLSLLTRQRTFLFWSFGAIFSYQAYSLFPVQESPVFLLAEYGCVLFGLYWDYVRKDRKANFVA